MSIFRLSWWLKPFIGFYWVRARDLITLSKYKQSLAKLDRIKMIRGPDIRPMGQWSAEFHILRGHCYYGMDQLEQAAACFEEAFDALLYDHNYEREECDYLRAYIITAHDQLDFSDQKSIKWERIELEYIDRDLKLYYPLMSHPDWPKPEPEFDIESEEQEQAEGHRLPAPVNKENEGD